MYEAVVARPRGRSTAARLAATASAVGFDGVILRRQPGTDPSSETDRLRERYGIDVVEGIDIDVDDPSVAAGKVGTFRDRSPVIIITGGGKEIDRFAVNQDRVDVIANLDRDAIDIGSLQAAASHDVHVQLDFKPILQCRGDARSDAITDLTRLIRLVLDYEVPYVITAGARSHLALRGPRALRAVGNLLDIDEEVVSSGLEAWAQLVAKNRDRLTDAYVAPGVKRLDTEDNDAG